MDPVSSGGAVAPPPRRGTSGSTPAAAPSVSATVSAKGSAPPDPETPPSRSRRGAQAGGEPRRSVHWYWRVLAWVVALPLGFVLTAYPVYKLGLVGKNDVLDIFVGSGTGRYTRLAIATAIWALVTALLVQLFVEGGRWLARRRRARHTTRGVARAV